jgi:uncharacterized protein YhjY with autotransporter beta-barrel domain
LLTSDNHELDSEIISLISFPTGGRVPTAFLPSARPGALTPHSSRFTASLLATTSLMALLLAAPAKAGEAITTPQASVTNPAGATTSFISITGTSVTGAVTNAGTITPGAAVGPLGTTVALFVNKSTIGGGIANTGTIVGAVKKAGIAIDLVGSTRHDIVVEAPIDAGDEGRGAVDVISGRGAGSRGTAELIISARPEIGVAEGEARDALLARIRGGALAKRATIRDEAVLHGLREHARRVEAELRALRQVLRARGKFGLAQSQVHVERVRGHGIGSDARRQDRDGRGDAREAAYANAGGITAGRINGDQAAIADPAGDCATEDLNAMSESYAARSDRAGIGDAAGDGARGDNNAHRRESGDRDNADRAPDIVDRAGVDDAAGDGAAIEADAADLPAIAVDRATVCDPAGDRAAAEENAGRAVRTVHTDRAAVGDPMSEGAAFEVDAPHVLRAAHADRAGIGDAAGDGAAGDDDAIDDWVEGTAARACADHAAIGDVAGKGAVAGDGDAIGKRHAVHGDRAAVGDAAGDRVAATYVATSASFRDGSHTNVDSYQGGAYVGWAGGPWYALGSAVVSFNDFSTSRLLTPFGLPGEATSSPSGQSYQGHAEAGYHWGQPAAGTNNISVTPYAALDYVNAHISGFSETGGFGALSVNAADSNSFQTTLGVRLTSRIQMTNMGTLIPELRLGWNHEFLAASQTLGASLIGVPGNAFNATGINFGRDTALIGAGLSLELSPDAKVFLDYDGKLSQRFQEHSVSGGLRVRF